MPAQSISCLQDTFAAFGLLPFPALCCLLFLSSAAFRFCPLLPLVSVLCSLVSFPKCLYCCHSCCNGSRSTKADTSYRACITAAATADISLSLLPLRTSLLSQHSLVDISRCALTTIHYPEHRTLTADEPTAEALPATMQHLAATAEALLAGGGHRWPTSAAAVQACDTSASSGGHHQSAPDPTAAVRDPSSHQAESSSHMTESFSRPDVMAKEGQQSEGQIVRAAVRHHTAGYDPVWMLLWAVKVNLAAMASTITMVSTVTMASMVILVTMISTVTVVSTVTMVSMVTKISAVTMVSMVTMVFTVNVLSTVTMLSTVTISRPFPRQNLWNSFCSHV